MAEKLAFCPLIRGSCDKSIDCYYCPEMHQEIYKHPWGYANWVCPSCLREVVKKAKDSGKKVHPDVLYDKCDYAECIHLTGHYAEGRCQYVGCSRPPRIEYGDGLIPGDETSWTSADLVERPSGYSRLLQLVIGDINS